MAVLFGGNQWAKKSSGKESISWFDKKQFCILVLILH